MIGFYLMTQKGFDVLTSVIDRYGSTVISFVISAKDEALSQDYFEEIRSICKSNNIHFFERNKIFELSYKFKIAISWRWIINDSGENLIVLHDSLLPKYRGFNPLVTALINGDPEIGATAIWATKEYDEGNIIYQSSFNAAYPLKIYDAIQKTILCYTDIVIKIIDDILRNKDLPSVQQDALSASYSLWRDKEDYRIDWNENAEKIKRFIDAVGNPYEGAHFYIDQKKITVIEAEIASDLKIANRVPGKLIKITDNVPYVVCGAGIIKLINMIDEEGKFYFFKRLRVRLK